MSEKNNQEVNTLPESEMKPVNPAKECIRVNKVYDWVSLESYQVQEVPIPVESLDIINIALGLGHQLLVIGTIDLPADVITDVVSVVRKTVIIDRKPVEVGCAQILKTVTLNISVFDVTEDSSNPITTFPYTFNIFERAGVCFPPPFTTDNIVLNITSADAVALIDVPVNDNFVFEVGICQDLQVETEVKLEVLAKFCEPRDNTIDCGSSQLHCPKPTFPKQCPSIFPGD